MSVAQATEGQYHGGLLYAPMAGLLLIVARPAAPPAKTLRTSRSRMFDEFLRKDRRAPVQVIVEERAEAVDPERAEGNLPDLKNPRKSG